MLFDSEERAGVLAVGDTDLTIRKTDVQQVTKVVKRDIPDGGLFWHLIGDNRSLRCKVTEVEVPGVLSPRADDELVLLVWYPCNGSDCIGVPILFLIIISFDELASEAETALALLFLFILFLVLLHLEFHHLHFPDSVRVVFKLHFEALSVADLVFVGLVDLVDKTRLTGNNNLG